VAFMRFRGLMIGVKIMDFIFQFWVKHGRRLGLIWLINLSPPVSGG
jgi:hypothetical protein